MTPNQHYADLIRAGFSLRVADCRHENRQIYAWFVDDESNAPAGEMIAIDEDASDLRMPSDLQSAAGVDGWARCAFVHADIVSPLDAVLKWACEQIPELAQRLANVERIELEEIAHHGGTRRKAGRL